MLAILNSDGTAVVNYTYDAWGKPFNPTGSMSSTLGTHNPLRYRGYVYDHETQLYYLQSRYYNPIIGRFINADAYTSTGQGLLGNNMFAYCLNNPENYSDPTGHCALCMTNRFSNQVSVKADCGCGTGGGYSVGGSYVGSGNKGPVEEIIDFISNTDEQAVLEADYFAFYKGVPVVKLPIGKNAFSFFVIFLGNDVDNIQTVQHEYGHSVHFSQIGVSAYAKTVLLPSLVGFWSGVDYSIYYSQPWERIADELGDVNRENYKYLPYSKEVADMYWIITRLISGVSK